MLLKHRLYLLSGYLSGACIIIIMLLVLSQIIGRLFGILVPSADDFSGFSLAAATFFGLAYTFHEGGHIRVNLLLQHCSTAWRRRLNLVVLGSSVCLMGYCTLALFDMIQESYEYGDVSTGYIPVPLWIPQLPLLIGMSAFTLALVDALLTCLRGDMPHFERMETDALSITEESVAEASVAKESFADKSATKPSQHQEKST